MRMDFKLGMEQKQTMQLSAQMIQSLNILMLPQLDLHERIIEEAEKNPALEIVRDSQSFSTALPESFRSGAQNPRRNAPAASMEASDAFQSFLENRPAQEETLQQHLLAQLAEQELPEREKELAALVIQNLDSRGFHREPPELLLADFAADPEQRRLLQRALSLVRSFDPVGTACSGIGESLRVQAELKGGAPELALKLLAAPSALLEKPRLSAVQKAFPEYSAAQFDEALDFIRTLDPHPARNFNGERAQTAAPDVYVYELESDSPDFDERFAVVAAEDALPVLRVSSSFKRLAEKGGAHSEGRDFALAQIRDAEQFLSALSQRSKTLVAVTRQVVRRQKAFFLGASPVPAPLRLQDVAEELGFHAATVSRSIAGKYLQCAQGLFEIKYFFQNAAVASAEPRAKNAGAVQGASSSAAASGASKEAVKVLLKSLLEDAAKAGEKLSDEKLSKLLAERGMPVSRRTVAKYRAQLNIASSYDR